MIVDNNTLRDDIPYDNGEGIKEPIHWHIKQRLNLCDKSINLHYGGIRKADLDDGYVMKMLFQIIDKNEKGSLVDPRLQYIDVPYNKSEKSLMICDAIEQVDAIINEDGELKLRSLEMYDEE